MGHLEPYAATRHSRATADQPAVCDAQPLVNCKLDERSSRTRKRLEEESSQLAFFVHEAIIPVLVNPEPE